MKERPRTLVRRLPNKQVTELEALHAVLDAALVAHVAVPAPGRLAVVPVGAARDGDRLLIHGSSASQAFRFLATGVETCTTITLLDGVVVARSQFESSMNYRSAMLFGAYSALEGPEKERGLAVLAEALMPGMAQARTPSPKELLATSVLALPLTEWSLKVSDRAEPDDASEDLDSPVWGGVVPLHHVWGEPVTAPGLPGNPDVPQALSQWPEGRS
ncbi:pyridoxamine 5'-phosphate oxidase family protein [Kineosporia succinea]|uniref:Nitroimidazol reductase NimA-like FMN-containing flavoprotein (Pyridoxamine 5'-phosphate oxidase superfamily) n=1 Tax=Kineosporia succinea TaxID=84632 RepID=A0ABT9NX22_9ACTN|nr:pyridoxamine 5'-phosphate oxidase family protein [Kineosporia succinea]MDP9824699.1 nitroimidazol reductase NimA-like FMN-containing flavoprotein (pyridoxamine 5'-phosphate oxidase superfamily) [Kineosporia succinea]